MRASTAESCEPPCMLRSRYRLARTRRAQRAGGPCAEDRAGLSATMSDNDHAALGLMQLVCGAGKRQQTSAPWGAGT